MNNISPNFTNTTVDAKPLGANLISRTNRFLKNLKQFQDFRTLPLMSHPGDRVEAMLLIPKSQMKDLTIIPNILNRGIAAINDRWHGRDTDKLIFRSVKVDPNGNLGKKTELVVITRKALFTVLSNEENLQLINSKLKDSRYDPENVLNRYKQIQTSLSVNLETLAKQINQQQQELTLTTKEQELTVREQEIDNREEQVAEREEKVAKREEKVAEREEKVAEQEKQVKEQALQLKKELERPAVLEQKTPNQLNTTTSGEKVVINSPAVPLNPQPEPEPVIITPNTGRPNDNPDDADRQALLSTGISDEKASKHAAFATY